MFCLNCGAEVNPSAGVCENCGAALPEPMETPAQVPETPVPYPEHEAAPPAPEPASGASGAPGEPAPKKGRTGRIAGIVAGVLVLAAALFLFVLNKKPAQIDPTRYLKVEYEGSDGRGYAIVGLEWEGLTEEVARVKKLETPDLRSDTVPEQWQGIVQALRDARVTVRAPDGRFIRLDDGVYKGPDNTGLRNGDSFVLKVVAGDDAALEAQGLRYADTEARFEVSGLRELPGLDPFEDLEITLEDDMLTGATLRLDYTGARSDLLISQFRAYPTVGLRNGDTVIISFDYDASRNEFVPTRTEIEYTVEGLSSYLTDYEQLSGAALAALDADAQALIFDAVQFEDADCSLPEPYGWALAVAPEPNLYENNELYLVYRAQISAFNPTCVPFEVFFPVRYTDLPDGDDVFSSGFVSGSIRGSFLFSTGRYNSRECGGYHDPYALCAELREGLKEGWSLSFGGAIAACDTGEDNLVTAPAQIPAAALPQLRECALTAAQMEAESEYESNGFRFTDWGASEAYLVVDPESAEPEDTATLAVVVSAHITGEDGGVDADICFVPQYSDLRYTPGGVWIGRYDLLLCDSEGSTALYAADVDDFFHTTLPERVGLRVEPLDLAG